MIPAMLPLALGAAISPSALAITVELLASRRPNRHVAAAAYLAGSAAPLLVLAVVSLVVDPRALGAEAASERWGVDLIDSVLRVDLIDAALGAALLAIAVVVFLRWRRSAGHPPTHRRRPTAPGALAAFGALMMATSGSTILLVIGALRDIARHDPSLLGEVAAVALLVATTLVPIWVPLAVDVAAPTMAQRALTPISRVVYGYGPAIVAAVSAVLAVYLLAHSLSAA